MIFFDFFKIAIIIIIIIGIILFIIYYKKSLLGYSTSNIEKENKQISIPSESIYDYKVSKEYEKMFLQPTINVGYQEYDKGIYPSPPIFLNSQKTIDETIAKIKTNNNSSISLQPSSIDLNYSDYNNQASINTTLVLGKEKLNNKSEKSIDTLDNIYDYNIINNLFKRLLI